MRATQTINYQEAYQTLQPKYEAVLQELAVLKRMVFGSKSERFIPADESKINQQLILELGAETIAQCRITDATTFTVTRTKTEVIRNTPKAHPGRMALPEHLRREITISNPIPM